MNGKIVISISITITIVIIAFSIIQSGEIKENPPAIEESDTMNPLLEKIKQDKIKNDNSDQPYYPKEREWIRSGPFTIDRSEYWLGEKIFVNLDNIDEKTKGEMVFAKHINSTHMYEYKKVKFDGSKPQQNFYLGFNLNSARGLCTTDQLIGEWDVIFRGTSFANLEFKVLDKILPGMEDIYKPKC